MADWRLLQPLAVQQQVDRLGPFSGAPFLLADLFLPWRLLPPCYFSNHPSKEKIDLHEERCNAAPHWLPEDFDTNVVFQLLNAVLPSGCTESKAGPSFMGAPDSLSTVSF